LDSRGRRERRRLDLPMEPDERLVARRHQERYVTIDISAIRGVRRRSREGRDDTGPWRTRSRTDDTPFPSEAPTTSCRGTEVFKRRRPGMRAGWLGSWAEAQARPRNRVAAPVGPGRLAPAPHRSYAWSHVPALLGHRPHAPRAHGTASAERGAPSAIHLRGTRRRICHALRGAGQGGARPGHPLIRNDIPDPAADAVHPDRHIAPQPHGRRRCRVAGGTSHASASRNVGRPSALPRSTGSLLTLRAIRRGSNNTSGRSSGTDLAVPSPRVVQPAHRRRAREAAPCHERPTWE
jgi:hypothetical protein